MVSAIIWTQEMSVNVSIIDEQHKKLIEIINRLNAAINDNATMPILDQVFDELTVYTKEHFSTEEGYFSRVNYSDSTSHQEEHDRFIYKLIALRNDFENGSKVVSNQIIDFLYGWLVQHIQGSDKAYSTLFNEHGIH